MGNYEARTKPTAVTVDAFIASVTDPVRQSDARKIDAMMRRVSGERPQMWGPSIIGYGEYHYRYATGHEGDAPRIGFSPRKAELVLYLLAYDEADHSDEESLLARLGKYRRGKACLYIRRLDQVDFDVLEQLAALSWRRIAERYPA